MDLLLHLYRESRLLLIAATAAGLVSGLCGAALIALIGQAVKGISQPVLQGAAFVGLCVLYLLTKTASQLALLHSTQRSIQYLRVELSQKLLRTPFTRLQTLGKHRLLAIFTKDIESFNHAFQLLPSLLGNGIMIVACLGYVAWLSISLFLFFSIGLVVCMAGFHLFERLPLRHLDAVRTQTDTVYEKFRHLIEGARELQLNSGRGDAYVQKVIKPAAQTFRHLFVRAMAGYAWVVNTGAICFYLLIGTLVFAVPAWHPVSPEILGPVVLMLVFLVQPVHEVMASLPAIREAIISLQRIRQLRSDLDEQQPDLAPVGTNPFIHEGEGLTLELKGVTHHYPSNTDDSQFLLGPIDLSIRQGETVFIVGGNGSGKTTLAMLLLGLYEPESGAILLNGHPVGPANRDHYRQHFSAVFADFHLFEELLHTDQQDQQLRAQHYIEQLSMAHKVKVADGRFSTTNLSSGQRKRLALVSSYLEDRPIYLFDEWAADQDPSFKRVFYTELLPELKASGKAVIVITHDDTYFSLADRLIKVHDGRLVEHAR